MSQQVVTRMASLFQTQSSFQPNNKNNGASVSSPAALPPPRGAGGVPPSAQQPRPPVRCSFGDRCSSRGLHLGVA